MQEEQFDLIDEYGVVTGRTASKSIVHDQELRHRGTHVWIYNSHGQVLLQLRDKAKIICPNTWDVSVAGHIHAGEEPLMTGIREAKEELGLDLEPSDFVFIGITSATPRIMPGKKLHRVFDWNYLAQRDVDISTLKLQDKETFQVAWKHIDDFEKEVLAPDYLEKYSYRDRYIYLMAVAEIRKRLGEIGSVS